MKPFANKTDRTNTRSELLSGKRPDIDQRLINDIFSADAHADEPTAAQTAPTARTHHAAHREPKLAQGTPAWESSSSSS